jgi:hypothetical protein
MVVGIPGGYSNFAPARDLRVMKCRMSSNTIARLSESGIRARAVELVRAHGPNKAGYLLGVSRDTALSLAAGAPVKASTLALVRETIRDDGL